MKLISKLFAALVVIGMSNAAFGYTFSMQNVTEKPVTVAVKVKGGSSQEQTVKSKVKRFTFEGSEANLCLESVSIDGKDIAIKGIEKKITGPRTSSDEPLCRNASIIISSPVEGEWFVWFLKE